MRIHLPLWKFSQDWLAQNRSKWQPAIIIAGVLLLIALLPTQASERELTLVLILIASGSVVLVLLRQPNLGFILVLLGSMFIPFSGPAGLNVTILLVALMLGLWILDMLIVKRQFHLVSSRPLRPLYFFLLISFFKGNKTINIKTIGIFNEIIEDYTI